MRLAFVTPLDSRATGVADYSLDLLPHLARAAQGEVVVFDALGDCALPGGAGGWRSRPIDDLPHVAPGVDLIVYQMGNSPAHDFMAPFLFRYPGLVVLHDVSLHDFFARRATRGGRPEVYLRAFGFGYGPDGARLARRYLRQPMPMGYPEYLLSEWLAARSPGVIVHSRHAAERLSERCAGARIEIVPMPMPVPAAVEPAAARARQGVANGEYVIVVFGMLNASKRPEAVLDAIGRLRAEGIPARAVFVGAETPPYRLAPEIERRGLAAAATHLGFVDLAEAQRWMMAADVAVGLRALYFGETSAAALRALATGTPLIVNNVGAYAELPDEACLKIAPGEPDVAEALCAALKALRADPDRRRRMGAAARAAVQRDHDPDRVARAYLRVAADILNGA
jgi:glycosyltransferase involved in cell wall biosynthesis